MATLAEALQGLNYTGADTGYGIAAQTLGQVAPSLINPYGSTGQAIGIGLGSVLLQSLLGYQARQQAARDTLELNTLANQMQTLATPQERTDFIGGVSDPMNQSRLSTLSTALMQQEAARQAKAAEKLLELETGADFELGPKGTELFKRKQQAELERALAARPPRTAPEEINWYMQLPASRREALSKISGEADQIRGLAEKFRNIGFNAVELNVARQVPGSNTDLAISQMNTMVPGIVKMLGDTGNLAQQEQENVKNALLGDRTSGAQTIAAKLEQLADMAEAKVFQSLEAEKTGITKGGDVLLEQLRKKQKAPAAQTDKVQKLEQLQAQLAELRRMRAEAGK
jgi:hypothetical protein